MEQAEEDHRAAQTAAATAHAREAEESAAEQELRLRLYSEAEEWLQEEGARTQYDLESAEVQVQAMKRARFESDARRLNQHTQDISMISDIQAQLGAAGEPSALTRALGNKAQAEQRAAAVGSAREIAERGSRRTRASACSHRPTKNRAAPPGRQFRISQPCG